MIEITLSRLLVLVVTGLTFVAYHHSNQIHSIRYSVGLLGISLSFLSVGYMVGYMDGYGAEELPAEEFTNLPGVWLGVAGIALMFYSEILVYIASLKQGKIKPADDE